MKLIIDISKDRYDEIMAMDWKNCRWFFDEEIRAIHDGIPQMEERWIPVSERLPEVGSEVLVCYEFKKHRSVYIADFYGDGKFHGLDDEYLTTEGRKYRKAIAWMPMPTPPNKSEIPTDSEGSEKND